MRPPRIAILALFFAASLFLFCRSVTTLARSGNVIAPAVSPKSRFTTFFSFNAPFTLFPPNAAISLTDDNSTTFAARPAAFGPVLPGKGMSGQLWIGSGFADDNLQEGEGEGELGCSDIPGWEDGKPNAGLRVATKGMSKGDAKSATAAGKTSNRKRDEAPKNPVGDRTAAKDSPLDSKPRPVDDGTDDYLHQGLPNQPKSHHDSVQASEPTHADIQSIQEAAEISGKIVLLSRGGCGFLEKVKWAQRRGAVALIVGDNQKGGPLIQMFARGDTSNITIPSVFTARTTAHLLSSLTQPGSFIEDTIDENGHPALKVLQSDSKARKNKKTKQQSAATTTPSVSKATGSPKSKPPPSKNSAARDKASKSREEHQVGWLWRLFGFGSSTSPAEENSSRPPSSGRLDWVLVDDWSDDTDKAIRDSLTKAVRRGHDSKTKSKTHPPSEDNFLIGVQDWRDPDLVGSSEGKGKSQTNRKDTGSSREDQAASSPGSSSKVGKGSAPDSSGPKGGSITPGSGEYNPGTPSAPEGKGNVQASSDDDGPEFTQSQSQSKGSGMQHEEPVDDDSEFEGHDGLWVTITPSSSASPFFDTLLVLVISPLITLTVVYALLILRARIRRRRWRAPKSVVERLPVRTYHTVAATPSHSPRLPSPTSASPTTPLLQQTPSRPRPRSRTTTGIPETQGLLTASAALQTPRSPARSEHEKVTGSISSEWKKYMGRQVECVVCLEEYVDGVSRVMSLPCGHEFHAECITPWLTTRRRTCPICKGDVVRSLARGSPSSPRYEPYHDDSDDDGEPLASGSGDRDSDAEHGILSPAPRRRQNRSDGWLGILSSSFGTSPRSTGSPTQEDRNR